VQTWSDQVPSLGIEQFHSQASPQVGIWRKHAEFSFVGQENVSLSSDGLHPIVNNILPAFTAWNKGDAVPAEWRKISELRLFDVNSHLLEAEDINGNSAATVMTSDQALILATVTNAKYKEFAYSGAEDKLTPNGFFGGMVSKGDGTIDPAKFHTGKASLSLPASKSGYNVTLATSSIRKHFQVSAWVHKDNISNIKLSYEFYDAGTSGPVEPTFASLTATASKKALDWYLVETSIPVPQSSTSEIKNYVLKARIANTGTAPVWIDDFRIHPYNSVMTSYVFDESDKLSHVLDNNNLYTEYKYDKAGRLTSTYKESFNSTSSNGRGKISEIKYNIGGDKILLRGSATGNVGSITPSGDNMVQLGSDYTYTIKDLDACQTNKLLSVRVDGAVLNQGSNWLNDGSLVTVSGDSYTFKALTQSHIIEAEFETVNTVGTAECHNNGGDHGGCRYNGRYDYVLYDQCGQVVSTVNEVTYSQVPAILRSQIIANCCDGNVFPSCNCNSNEQ
jgi:hypothetical protein